MSFYTLSWLVVLLPLLGWIASFMAVTPRRSAQISVGFCGLALLVATTLLGYRGLHQSTSPYESVVSFWEMKPVESGVFAATLTPAVGVRVDALSVVFMVAVSLISLVVQWHAIVLMKADAESRRLFQAMAFFTTGVLGVVVSPNLFQFWLMWEVVAVAAYILAAHWWTSSEVAGAGRRMFLYLRMGDLALFFGVIFTLIKFGPHASSQPAPPGLDVSDPLSFSVLSGSSLDPAHAGEWHIAHSGFVLGVGPRTLAVLGAILLIAAAVRACQFPFHAWLAEAAEAPPPAVALMASLLAATGVVLMARVYPLFLEIPHLLTVVAVLGTSTALFCALAAWSQRDLVRLAVLTSAAQLGLIVAGLGMGGFSRPLFALVVSMLMIALLLIVVSNIVRAYRTQEVQGIAGMWPRMRWTSAGLGVWAAGVSGASLVNYNVLASIFHNTTPAGGHAGTLAKTAVAAGVTAAMLVTAAGAVRLAAQLLRGRPAPRRGLQPERIAEGDSRLVRAMAVIVGALAFAVVLGAVPRTGFAHFVYFGDQPQNLDWDAGASLATVLLGAAAAGIAWALPTWNAGAVAHLGRLEVGAGLARLASAGLGRAGRTVSDTDTTVLDGFADALGQGVSGVGKTMARGVTARLGLQIGVGLAVTGALAAGSILAATGHLPGGP